MNTPERKLREIGPNYAVDAVIVSPDSAKIVLIKRKDNGEWALPGGFIDENDPTPHDAAVREALEETNITLEDIGMPVFRGKVDDPRNTVESWVETEAYCFILPKYRSPKAGDDAGDAKWHSLDSLPRLHGLHLHIIEQALRYIDDPENYFFVSAGSDS